MLLLTQGMRILSIQQYLYQPITPAKMRENKDSYSPFYSLPLSFGKIANAGQIKMLFTYKLPCMYSGVDMIDPKLVRRMMKNGIFNLPSGELIKHLADFEPSLSGIEERVYQIIKEESAFTPEKTVQEIIQGVAPIYQRRLRKKQAPIFAELTHAAQDLPDNYRYQFNRLMQETDDKLNDRPTLVPFSSYEFRYKLEKVRNSLSQLKEKKPVRVLNKMLKETERLADTTTPKNEDSQKKIISFLEIILKRSVLSQGEELNNILAVAKSRLNHEKTKMPLKRKSFIYDLDNIIKPLPDKDMQERLLSIAFKLPTSSESMSAYITKIAPETSEKMVYRILWPFFASVEHILPKSCGGEDAMHNFGGACTRENTLRQNIPFVKQMKRKPETKFNCQKYLDRLIELFKKGIFKKHNISTKYIDDFKKTIQRESNGAIVLDTTGLYK